MFKQSDPVPRFDGETAARRKDQLPMKVVLVGDNRMSPNWGRGADLALYQMLSERFEIIGTIPGSYFLLHCAGFGYINTFTPARYNSILLQMVCRREKKKVFDWYASLEELFGAKDFIAEDPQESVDNLIRHKHRYPQLAAIYNLVSEADLVIVNGNGDMVLTAPPRREALFLLAMTRLGTILGKKVAFINSMLSDCPQTGRNRQTLEATRMALSKCQAVSLRDPTSMAYAAKEMPEVKCTYIPDSLFSWYPLFEDPRLNLPMNGDFSLPFPEHSQDFGMLDFSKPYVCVGGSGLAAKCGESLVPYFTQLVNRIKELGYVVYLTVNDGPDSFLEKVGSLTGSGIIHLGTSILLAGAILANAKLFISGRYHPSVFASLGGTPCIFLDSQAHKMTSLQQVMEYEQQHQFPLFFSKQDLDDIVSLSVEYIRQGDSLRSNIRKVASRRCHEASNIAQFILEHT